MMELDTSSRSRDLLAIYSILFLESLYYYFFTPRAWTGRERVKRALGTYLTLPYLTLYAFVLVPWASVTKGMATTRFLPLSPTYRSFHTLSSLFFSFSSTYTPFFLFFFFFSFSEGLCGGRLCLYVLYLTQALSYLSSQFILKYLILFVTSIYSGHACMSLRFGFRSEVKGGDWRILSRFTLSCMSAESLSAL